MNLYQSGAIENRTDVQKIIKTCGGCHYGSYPEVTISVRDPKAFVERSLMVLFSGSGKLAKAPIQEGFLAEIENIKAQYPTIYPKEQWLDRDLINVLETWKDSNSRREILKQDLLNRKEQGRVRGLGSDVLISAEKGTSRGSE